MHEHNPVPKPKHKRQKKTAKQRGAISSTVYKLAHDRSGGVCERCGRGGYLECAHLIRRWKIETETTVHDVAMLCGPAVNTGTCHNWIDYTQEGREWALAFRDRLYREDEMNER